MAATAVPSLSTLLNKASLDDHDQILATAESVLKTSRTDPKAQHVKAVALLKTDKFVEAVDFMESCGPQLLQDAALEYSYALYKAGRLQEAIEVASKLSSRGALHVQAQARYRLEDYRVTSEIYTHLTQQHVSTEDFDLKVNQGAIDAQGLWLGLLEPSTARKPGREDLEAFETAYNAACGSVARGELAQAEILLKRAKELCKHSDELTEVQKAEELLPIAVQQTYVLHRLGKTAEANAVAQEINVDMIQDLATRKVACSNQLLEPSSITNPYLAYKTFHSTPAIPASESLFTYQSVALSSNEKTISLNSFKASGIIESTRKQAAAAKSPSTDPDTLISSAYHAAACARNQIGNAAINQVLPELERRPTDIGLVVAVVQMYTMTGNTTSAILLLESFCKKLESSVAEFDQDARFHPGVMSVLISLYRAQGRKRQAKEELAKAASYWRHKSAPPITLLRAAGISLLGSSSAKDIKIASEIFNKLYEKQPKEMATIAGYIASHATDHPEMVQKLASKLTPVSDLIKGVDVDSLEKAGIPQSSNALAIAQGPSKKRAAAQSEVSKEKRIRKSRLPKDFDPSQPTKPDPERWLPMRDRSYYRPPKSKRKGRKADDRTQGGNVNEDLDINKREQKGTEGTGGGGGGGKSKKKGKGHR